MLVSDKQTRTSTSSAPADGASSARDDRRAQLRGATYAEGAAALAPVQLHEAADKKKPAADTSGSGSLGAADPKGILAGLHPAFAAKIRQLLANAHARGLNVFIFEGMRSHARQAALYAQGRSKPGDKVTWVTPGGSYHQYGLAADIVFHGAQPWGEQHDWTALGAAGRAAGLVWGGTYGNRPHFRSAGVNIADLKKWYAKGGLANTWAEASKVLGGGSFEAPGQDGSAGTYRVRPGDTLVKIATRFYGTSRQWRAIADLNGIADPRALEVGTVLQLPGHERAEPSARAIEYKVGRGDTLAGIAKRYLGDAERWPEIAEANGISDPRALAIGTVLKVPPADGRKAEVPKPTFTTVKIKKGDTLAQLAGKYLGSAKRWPEIADLNSISDPTKLSIGATLTIAI